MRNLKSFGLVAGLILATNVCGLLRELLTARALGVEAATDSFFVAFRIISAAFLLFSAGALQAAFMPEYQRLLAAGRSAEAGSLFRRAFAWLTMLVVLLSAGIALGADGLVGCVAPGFSSDLHDETVRLLRLLTPVLPLTVLGSLLQAASHARGRFAAPALVPLANNLVIIASLVLLVPTMSLTGLALGNVVGALLWLIVLLPTTRQAWRGPAADESACLRSVAAALPALVALTVCDQLTLVVQQRFASDLGDGAISALNYAARLQALPVGIVAGAFATVAFPALVAAAGSDARDVARRRILDGVGFVTLLTVPCTVVCVWQAAPCVRLLFEHGAFNTAATAATAAALAPYGWSIVPLSLVLFLNRVFYATCDRATPLYVGAAAMVLNLVLARVGVERFSYPGIAVATAASGLVYAVVLLAIAGRRFAIRVGDWLAATWRPVAAAAAMAVVLTSFGSRPSTFSLFASWIAGSVVYAAVLAIAGEPTLRRLLARSPGASSPSITPVALAEQRAA